MRSPRTLACGPNGHCGAGPVATAEAGGAAGSRGRGKSPGAWALAAGRRCPWAGPQWASCLPAAQSRRRPGGSRPGSPVGAPGGRGPSSGRACAEVRDPGAARPAPSRGLDSRVPQRCAGLPARPVTRCPVQVVPHCLHAVLSESRQHVPALGWGW